MFAQWAGVASGKLFWIRQNGSSGGRLVEQSLTHARVLNCSARSRWRWSNPSIERTSYSRLRLLPLAAHVERPLSSLRTLLCRHALADANCLDLLTSSVTVVQTSACAVWPHAAHVATLGPISGGTLGSASVPSLYDVPGMGTALAGFVSLVSCSSWFSSSFIRSKLVGQQGRCGKRRFTPVQLERSRPSCSATGCVLTRHLRRGAPHLRWPRCLWLF